MIRRATVDDVAAVQAIIGEAGDAERWLAEPRNVVLWDGANVALFLWRWIGVYEGHVQFEARGREAIDLAGQMLGLMRGAGAAVIIAVTSQPAAAWFLRQIGFTSYGLIPTIEGMSEMFQLEFA